MGSEQPVRILIVTTGGTIATFRGDDGRVVPAAAGARLLDMLGLKDDHIRYGGVNSAAPLPILETDAPFTLPSSHMDFPHMWEMRQRILAARDEGFDAVIITHGTDTIEETAFFLRCGAPADFPVILTGAMRGAALAGPDGPANLSASIIAAQHLANRRRQKMPLPAPGPVLVMNDEIHAARLVTKSHTVNVASFSSAPFGPLGVIQEGEAFIPLHLAPDNRLDLYTALAGKFDGGPGRAPGRGAAAVTAPDFPEVELITVTAGMSTFLLEQAAARNPLAIVIEGSGGGHVPPDAVPVIEEAIARDIIVVMSTRCPEGYPLRSTYSVEGGEEHLRSLGAVNCRLGSLKTRIFITLMGLVEDDRDHMRRVIDAV